ncbi:MAG: hypothetical protein ACYC4J_14445 [Gemmatimonadaceae bacterium]
MKGTVIAFAGHPARLFHISRATAVMSESESEQTYGEERARNLERLLRGLAERIRELDAGGALLSQTAELMKLIGDVKSELFHYEVRATYDTPEVSESRRIVKEAIERAEVTFEKTEWKPEREDDPEW